MALWSKSTLRAVDRNVSFKAVHASKGKIVRAEPVAALFEQNRAHLVGAFPMLEDQLCTYSAGSSDSPDRLDAAVWGLSDLMVAPQHSVQLLFGKLEGRDPLTIARGRLSTDHYRSHGL